MESNSDEQMELPPGFRFHPTDEELITHYLCQKVLNTNFDAVAIGEADLNKVEPWDLPRKAKMGEKEWYFFYLRDRKYPTGMRTNRATKAGYWKATGKDKEIFEAKMLVGMKKTLVFYTGRAPKGEKTNWIMHEYRLDGKYSKSNLPQTSQNEWVLSRVFEKSSAPKNPNDPPSSDNVNEVQPRVLPPLMDSTTSYKNIETRVLAANPSHVTCFSSQGLMGDNQKPTITMTTTTTTKTMPTTGLSGTPTLEDRPMTNPLVDQNSADFEFLDSIFTEDDSILKFLHEGRGGGGLEMNNDMLNFGMTQNFDGPIDLDSLWGY